MNVCVYMCLISKFKGMKQYQDSTQESCYFSCSFMTESNTGFRIVKLWIYTGKSEDAHYILSLIPEENDSFFRNKKIRNQTRSPFSWTQLTIYQEASLMLLLRARGNKLEAKIPQTGTLKPQKAWKILVWQRDHRH